MVLLEIKHVSLIADYFVICSASSDRQIKAIADEISETLAKEEKIRPIHVEGTFASGWVLIDYGDVVVHIFSPQEREFYRLEKLWSEAVPVLRIA